MRVPPEKTAKDSGWTGRAEIETSARFESVREAVDHFGGSGLWRKQHERQSSSESEEIDRCSNDLIPVVNEQSAKLKSGLIRKEQETLGVLKELEKTKRVLAGLKMKLYEHSCEASILPEKKLNSTRIQPFTDINQHIPKCAESGSAFPKPKRCPSLILMELKQAKLNLNKTTSDIASIRLSIKRIKIELEKEKYLTGKIHQRMASNSAQISSLEKELCQIRLILQFVEDSGYSVGFGNPLVSRRLHERRSETEQFRRMATASKIEAFKISKEIEQRRSEIMAAEVKVTAAKKVEESARATEAAALAKIKYLKQNAKTDTAKQNYSGITLSLVEYNMLVHRARQAEGISKKRIEAAKFKVEEAHKFKMEFTNKVEEANRELKNCQKALNEALNRVQAAEKGKAFIEEAFRKLRSDHSQKRRSIQSSPRFKNAQMDRHRKDFEVLNANGVTLIIDGSKGLSRPTLSIGEILNKRLLGSDELDSENTVITSGKSRISLGQMLDRKHETSPGNHNEANLPRKSFQAKKKRFGFVGNLPKIMLKHKKNKKRQARIPK